MNKYEKWYNQITQNGKKTRKPGHERHHILPQCMGGGDEIENITFITAREHFICHWLLTKIYPAGEEHWQMVNALRIMRAENQNQTRYSTKITSRVYAKLKEEYSELQSIRMTGEGNPMYGRAVSEEVRKGRSMRASGDNNPAKLPGVGKKISEAKTGVKREEFDDAWKENLSNNHKSKQLGFDGSHSEDTKKKIGDALRGKKQSPETIQKKADAIRGSKREKQLCPHCGQHIAVNTYPRFHGDNCKEKK